MAEVVTSDVDGLQLRRSGKGTPLLLLHGWAMSGAVFTELLASPPAGLELIAIDLPGHGGSEPLAESSLDSWAERIEELSATLSLGPVSILGWSLGGMLAMRLAARGMLDLQRLLLVSTTPRFTRNSSWFHGLVPTQLRAMQRDLKRAYRPTLEGFFKLMFAADELSRERYRQIARFATGPTLVPSPEVAAAGLKILQQEDLCAELETLVVPSLVLHGEDDAIIPASAGKWLAQNLPNARLEMLPGVGHAPFLSRPEMVSRSIGAFCA